MNYRDDQSDQVTVPPKGPVQPEAMTVPPTIEELQAELAQANAGRIRAMNEVARLTVNVDALLVALTRAQRALQDAS